MFFLPTTHYPLPTTYYPLPTTHYPLPICEAYAKALATRRPLGLPT